MATTVLCPKCNKRGSLQLKKTKHGNYWRVAHYIGLEGKTRKIQWCYIGKELPNSLKEQLITQNKQVITQQFTQRDTESENLNSGSISQNIQSEEFDAYVDFFWNTNPHDSSHCSFFCVDVDEAFVNAHLPSIPSGGSFAARGFSNWHPQSFCGEWNGTGYFDTCSFGYGL